MPPVDTSPNGYTKGNGNRMNPKDWLQFVRDVGIPAAIAFYVLMRLEPAINANTEAINKLALVVATVIK